MVRRQGAHAAIGGVGGPRPKRLGCALWVGEKPTAESEGTRALEDRGWVRSCCRAWGRRGGIVGGEPKGMVSGRAAGVLKGQQEKGPRARAGASRLARGPGRTGVGITGPYLLPTGSGEQSHNLRLPGEIEGATLSVPAKTCLPTPVSAGPTRTHLAPAAWSGTALPR